MLGAGWCSVGRKRSPARASFAGAGEGVSGVSKRRFAKEQASGVRLGCLSGVLKGGDAPRSSSCSRRLGRPSPIKSISTARCRPSERTDV